MRTPSIRYFASRGAYYTQHKRKQHLLASGPRDEPDGPTYRAAVQRFADIMEADGVQVAEVSDRNVSSLIFRYYDFLEQNGQLKTLKITRTLLDFAVVEFGETRVADLKPYIVSDWLAKMAKQPDVTSTGHEPGRRRAWSLATQHGATGSLLGVFNWAVKQGIIDKNPITSIPRLEKRCRGSEVVMPEPLQDLLVEGANGELAKLLRVLRGTGARPGEIMHAECRHYRPGIRAIVHPWNPPPGDYLWKCAKKKKRDRVIYLNDELRELVEAEVKLREGRGVIFQTARGKPWTGNNLRNRVAGLALLPAVQKWCGENGFDASKIISYAFRHSFITRMLANGAPVKFVADLCGTSVKQIERTYSHVHDDHAAMYRLFEQFSCGRTSG